MDTKILAVLFAVVVAGYEALPVAEDGYRSEIPSVRVRRSLNFSSIQPDYVYKDKLTRTLEGTTGNSDSFSSGLDSPSYSSRNSKSYLTPEPRHEIVGSAYADNPSGVGVGLGYKHIPSGSELSASMRHNDYSAEATVGGKLNLHKSENSQLDAFADYSKHYGNGGADSRGKIGFEFKKTW